MIARRNRGFTLLELLVVMLLLALLVATVAPSLSRWPDSARERGWRADLEAALLALPVRAFRAGAALSVDDKALRRALPNAPDDLVIELTQPLNYSAVGLSEGGELRVGRVGRAAERWQVEAVTGDVRRPGNSGL